MIVSRARHTGFVVRDIERSLKFYCGILGLTVYKRETEQGEYIEKLVGIKNARVEWVKLNIPGGGLIELLEYHSHPDPEVSRSEGARLARPSGEAAKISQPLSSNRLASGHIALTVENLDALYKTLVAGGYECNSAPLLAPGGKAKILYCHDPDGIIIELIEDLN